MMPADQLGPDDLRYVWNALTVHPLDVIPAIFQALFSDLPSHLVSRLQIREPQPQASKAGLLRGAFSS